MGLAGSNISFVARASVKHDGTVACHDALIPGAGEAVSSFIDEDTVTMLLASNEHAVVRASLGVPALDVTKAQCGKCVTYVIIPMPCMPPFSHCPLYILPLFQR